MNAGKRLIVRFRQEHPQMQVIVGGDDLYSHEPFVILLGEKRLHFVLVAKPESHKELFEWVEDLDRLGECEKGRWHEGPAGTRRFFEYRIARAVPLKADGQVEVNFVEVPYQGVYDKLTAGPLTGGRHVAGTGTMAPDGSVGRTTVPW